MKKFDILGALIMAFAWGSNYTAVAYLLTEIPGFLAVAIRFLITALLLLPFIKKPNVKFSQLYSISLVYGVFYIGLFYYGMYLGFNTSLTIIIMQLHIPFTVILAAILFKEHVPLLSIIGIATAFIGMIIVVGKSGTVDSFFALIILLISACSSAIFNIQSKSLKSIPALEMVFWTNLIAAPHLFLISYLLEGNPFRLLQGVTYITWWSMAYNVIIASFIAMFLWISLLQKYPVYKVAPYTLLVPFFGISIAVVLLGDGLSWNIVIGGSLTIIGVALSNGNILAYFRKKYEK